MSDATNTNATGTNATGENPGLPSFAIRGQYVKDLSFENPNAPQSLISLAERPAIDVNVDLKSEKLQDNFYETTIHIVARARAADSMIFLVDLSYSGVFELLNIPEDRIEPLLWIECPFVLFPFARRVVADVTRDGGFPPLMLDPIDFHGLYQQKREQMRANEQQSGQEVTGG